MNQVVLPELPIKKYSAEISKYYDFHFCQIEEIDEVVQFIDQYWQKNHILVLSRTLLDWQHLDQKHHRYNFVVARSKTNHQIEAILGFVPTSQFDENIEHKEVWPCIWKANAHGLGLLLFYYLTENYPMSVFTTAGNNSKTIKMYQAFGFETGILNQYYLLNNEIDNYELLKFIKQSAPAIADSNDNLKLKLLNRQEFENYLNNLTIDYCKSKKCYLNRFFKHPFYKYDAFGIFDSNHCKAIFFIRECSYKKAKALRIVDFIGEKASIVGLFNQFQNLLKKRVAEYLDFVLTGWNEDILLTAGFKKRGSEVILAHYYEPFELKNVDLNYGFKSADENNSTLIYKADGDQDRPSLLLV